jgi:hypothetical protein
VKLGKRAIAFRSDEIEAWIDSRPLSKPGAVQSPKGISDSKREDDCRAQLKVINDQRLAAGKDLYPDQCGR